MFKEKVEKFLQTFVELYDAKLVAYTFDESDEKICKVKIDTTENGLFIGKNGRTLKDIELILETMSKIENYGKKIQFNVGDYREKHDKMIKEMALEKAKYVSKTNHIHVFPPMNSYERRLIHTTVSESVFGILVKTESVGEGKERHTVLRSK